MVIWIEQLSILKLLLALSYKLFFSHIEIRYTGITSSAGSFLKLLRRSGLSCGWIIFQELVLGVKTEKGEALRYRAEELTSIIVEEVLVNLLSAQDFIPEYLKKHSHRLHAIFKSYLISYFKRKINYLCFIENLLKINPEFKNKEPVYWLDYIPLSSKFNTTASRYFKGTLRIWPNPILIARERLPLRILISLIGCLLSCNGFKKHYTKLRQDNRTKILVEFVHNKFGKRDYNFLFWFPESEVSSERIIMGFDRPDSSCSQDSIQLIERHNMRWLDLKLSSLCRHVLNPFRLFISILIRTPFPRLLSESYMWRWKVMLESAFFLEVWQQIFRGYKIKVFHQHQEHNFWSHIQSLAIDMEGGIYFWFHWSLDRMPVSHFNAGYCDVFFSWGKFHRDYIDMHNFKYSYMLDIGTVLAGGDTEEKQSPPELDKNINFIISLFDVGSSPWGQFSPYSEFFYYDTMLSLVLEHRDWGVIIKSKHGIRNLPNGDKIEKLINALTSQKRCIYLPKERGPAYAAGYADICVCHGINSAGSIAALSGSRVIHWDLAGNTRHPYYSGPAGNIVSTASEELKNTLETFARDKDKHSHIGDHSYWLDMLDPYRDGKSGLRAGQFIKSFLSYIGEGVDRDNALKQAVEKFSSQWGQDKIFPFETRNERLKDNIWIKADKTLRKE